jgi:hypothetical protein
MPRHTRFWDAWPYTIKLGTILRTRSIGSAKFTPLLCPDPSRVKVAVLTPTTRPDESKSGPPLFPTWLGCLRQALRQL